MSNTTNNFSNLLTKLKNERSAFEQITMSAVPDSPSEKGYSAGDIKQHIYLPDIKLYDLSIDLVEKISNFNQDFISYIERLEKVEADGTIYANDIQTIKDDITALETEAAKLPDILNDISQLEIAINNETSRAKAKENELLVDIESNATNIASNLTKINNAYKLVEYNHTTGKWTFTYHDGTKTTIDTNAEKLPISFTYDEVNERIVMVATDGTESYIPLTSLTNTIQHVQVSKSDDGNKLTVTVTSEEIVVTEEFASFNFANALKSVQEQYVAKVDKLITDLQTEIERATEKETSLEEALTDLENRAVLDSELTTNESNEISQINAKNIHASTSDKATSDANGNNIVNTYETKANANTKYTTLQNNIDVETLNRRNAIKTVEDSIQNHFVANPSDFDSSVAVAIETMKVNGVDYYGMKGDKGDQGVKGDTGQAAGFGTPIANTTTLPAGQNAQVGIEASGSNTSKVFTFNFKIPKGDKGEQGIQGIQGNAASITGATASVDNNVGTPSVVVTNGGTDSARSFNFAFKNLKGEKGDKGDKGDTGTAGQSAKIVSANATIDANVGTPAVEVSSTGTEFERILNFSFSNLKGEKGDKGDTGEKGEQGDKGDKGDGIAIVGVYGTEEELLEAHPTGNINDLALVNGILYQWDATSNQWLNTNQSLQGPQGETGPKGEKGEQGIQGVAGTNGYTFTPSVDTNGNLSWTNNGGLSNPATVNIKGDKGDTGEKGEQGEQGIQGVAGVDGVGISSIVKQGTSGLVDTYLITLTNNAQYTFPVTNGAKGDKGDTGDKGDKGDTGATGATGPYPTLAIGTINTSNYGEGSSANFVDIPGGYRLNLTLERGPQGLQGIQGVKGDTGDTGATGSTGENGATFTPSVDASGNLSWTNDKNLTNPNTVNIKGPKGDKGETGDTTAKYTITLEDNGETLVITENF